MPDLDKNRKLPRKYLFIDLQLSVPLKLAVNVGKCKIGMISNLISLEVCRGLFLRLTLIFVLVWGQQSPAEAEIIKRKVWKLDITGTAVCSGALVVVVVVFSQFLFLLGGGGVIKFLNLIEILLYHFVQIRQLLFAPLDVTRATTLKSQSFHYFRTAF